MLRVQVLLLLALLATAADPATGEGGLAELAAARASISLVSGEASRSVQRLDEPDAPVEAKRLRFAVATDGRYDLVETDPKDPDGERLRIVSDGRTTWTIALMDKDDQALPKAKPAANDVMARMSACLRLDPELLRRDYTVELAAVADGLRELRLVPSDPALAREITRVVVTLNAQGRPTRLLLDEPAGNRHRLDISAFNDDPPVDPGWFKGP